MSDLGLVAYAYLRSMCLSRCVLHRVALADAMAPVASLSTSSRARGARRAGAGPRSWEAPRAARWPQPGARSVRSQVAVTGDGDVAGAAWHANCRGGHAFRTLDRALDRDSAAPVGGMAGSERLSPLRQCFVPWVTGRQTNPFLLRSLAEPAR